MVLAISAISVWLASDPDSLVLALVSYAWAGFGAAFGPLIILSLWWRRMTRNGALVGMIVGTATVLIWHKFAWFGLYEIVPGFILSTLSIIVVSLLDKAPPVAVTRVFDDVSSIIKASR